MLDSEYFKWIIIVGTGLIIVPDILMGLLTKQRFRSHGYTMKASPYFAFSSILSKFWDETKFNNAIFDDRFIRGIIFIRRIWIAIVLLLFITLYIILLKYL